MHPVLFVQSDTAGVLVINGQFCGPLEGTGQTFPAGRDAEIYLQLCPFGRETPVTAGLQLRGGTIERLFPQESAFALIWPDGMIQIELCAGERPVYDGEMSAADGVLLRYLLMRFSGDAQAQCLLLRAQDAPDLSEYEAAVPLRFAPLDADPRYDERAGLVRRLAPNVAAVDAALAMTAGAGGLMRRIERIAVKRT